MLALFWVFSLNAADTISNSEANFGIIKIVLLVPCYKKTLSLHSCKDSQPSNEFFRDGHEKTPPYDDTHFCLMKIILFKLIARTGKLVVGNPIPIPNTENRYWDQENTCIVRHIFCQVTVWKWAQKLANWRKIQVKSNDFCPCYLFFEKTFVKLMQM